MELDLGENRVKLANLIFDVSKECDPRKPKEYTIDLSDMKEDFLTELKICRLYSENPNLPAIDLQEREKTIIETNKQEKEERVANKARKKERIKRYINGDAKLGYELAYRMCREDDSKEARFLMYRMIGYLKNLSVEEKIEICRMYVDYLEKDGEAGNKIAEVYCRMARLVYPINKTMDYSSSFIFYETAYEYINEPTWMLNEIMAFCNEFGIYELKEKCCQKKSTI